LQRELGRLVEAEIVYHRGLPPQATYTFKHALIQDAAYASLLKSTRQRYHQRIAQVLKAQFPETVEAEPELLAHHYTEAGLAEQAVHNWHHAGQSAIQRSAHVEAIAHLRQGLALLQMLPETLERTQREVDMLIALGASLLAIKGYTVPEVGETYTRARHLCQSLADPQQLVLVLWGLWAFYITCAELRTAHALGEQLLLLAQDARDTTMLVAAHTALGVTLFFLGEIAAAHTHLAQGITLYDPQQHRASAFLYREDIGVICHSYAAWTLWCLGSPEQGLARSGAAATVAQHLAYPFSQAHALVLAALFHALRHEVRVTQERAEAAIVLATEQAFPHHRAIGALLHGWTLAHQGQAQDGIAQLRQGLTACQETGIALLRPHYLALLAEAYGTIGQHAAGLQVLTEALTRMDTTGERV
jgi:predicted ATPase